MIIDSRLELSDKQAVTATAKSPTRWTSGRPHLIWATVMCRFMR